jgi:hypothetical protein
MTDARKTPGYAKFLIAAVVVLILALFGPAIGGVLWWVYWPWP